jgi:hypothetical protein
MLLRPWFWEVCGRFDINIIVTEIPLLTWTGSLQRLHGPRKAWEL